jgi:glucose-1-phosphate thymidylyltransferase
MTGIILCGGNGTRLRPLTYVANKHLLPVYNKPMIYYPIETLKRMGCTDIILISGGENIGGFADLLQNGAELGVRITYRVQPEAGGVAQALQCAEGLVSGIFPVILGDNYFGDAIAMPDTPTLYIKAVDDPERFGVYDPAKQQIVEKPQVPVSGLAVTGLYVYDQQVFDMIGQLTPSARNELEITDVNNMYLKSGMSVQELTGYWSDMGTFDSLLRVANIVSDQYGTV